ncbi:MAG: sigma-70 family RNA polymerase sigma factor [Tissierellia bacterium]|jgi:RNA polymerase sigma-70 factor (ECF subfamily)|nr:sigma-70 family RNA polymerase sigma factor [Tissierellia bacterium]
MYLDTNNHISEIVHTYSDMVYKLALARTKNKFDADDVFQEVFIRCMKNYNKFTSNDHIKAWLIRVTINCSNNIFNSSWFKKTVLLNNNLKDNSLDDLNFSTEENKQVYHSVLELPKKYRTVIHLFYYEDMSIREISKALKIKEGTIKSQLHRGRNLLKEILEGEIFDV